MQPDSPTYRVIRKLLPYTTAALVLAVVYVLWIFASRWNENRQLDREAAAQKAKAQSEITETYGGSQLKIVSFYVTPAVIARGEKGLICYGVANAKTVRLEPPVERVWPSVSRCFEVAPKKETRYTLTAEDGQGHSASESVVLQVK